MTASAIIARRAPAPSSPAQVRAAQRLRGSDAAAAAEHKLAAVPSMPHQPPYPSKGEIVFRVGS
jgi:hypothetical protein